MASVARQANKRVGRFQSYGWEGVGDRSRSPRCHPNSTSLAVAQRLILARQAHPTWGPKKLVAWLHAVEPEQRWPAPSMAGDILGRAGLVRRRKRRRHASAWSEPFVAAERPNDVWSIDLKGWFRTHDGVRIDPLTVQDAASRYLLVCHGLPRAIRSDNEPPFASVGLGSLSQLAIWWVKLDITPGRIEPGHPEQNGRLERLHRTLKAETASPPQATRRRQQRAFDAFRQTYNDERPHEALGHQPHARRYHPSFRSYHTQVSAPEYEAGMTVRQARTNGQIKWKGNTIYLSEALKAEPVGLAPQNDRFWTIRFGPLSIGLLDDYARFVLHTPTKVSPMSSV